MKGTIAKWEGGQVKGREKKRGGGGGRGIRRGVRKGRKEKIGVQQASFLPLDPALPEAGARHGLVSYMRGKLLYI